MLNYFYFGVQPSCPEKQVLENACAPHHVNSPFSSLSFFFLRTEIRKNSKLGLSLYRETCFSVQITTKLFIVPSLQYQLKRWWYVNVFTTCFSQPCVGKKQLLLFFGIHNICKPPLRIPVYALLYSDNMWCIICEAWKHKYSMPRWSENYPQVWGRTARATIHISPNILTLYFVNTYKK